MTHQQRLYRIDTERITIDFKTASGTPFSIFDEVPLVTVDRFWRRNGLAEITIKSEVEGVQKQGVINFQTLHHNFYCDALLSIFVSVTGVFNPELLDFIIGYTHDMGIQTERPFAVDIRLDLCVYALLTIVFRELVANTWMHENPPPFGCAMEENRHIVLWYKDKQRQLMFEQARGVEYEKAPIYRDRQLSFDNSIKLKKIEFDAWLSSVQGYQKMIGYLVLTDLIGDIQLVVCESPYWERTFDRKPDRNHNNWHKWCVRDLQTGRLIERPARSTRENVYDTKTEGYLEVRKGRTKQCYETKHTPKDHREAFALEAIETILDYGVKNFQDEQCIRIYDIQKSMGKRSAENIERAAEFLNVKEFRTEQRFYI